MKKILIFVLVLIFINIHCDHRLIDAVKRNDIKKIERLLKAGVNVNYHLPNPIEEDLHPTALLIAAENNRIDIMKLLLESDAEVNARYLSYPMKLMGVNSLYYAVINNNLEMVKLLISYDCDIDRPIGASILKGRYTGKLYFNGSDGIARNNHILSYAIYINASPDVVEELIKVSNLHALDVYGHWTPMKYLIYLIACNLESLGQKLKSILNSEAIIAINPNFFTKYIKPNAKNIFNKLYKYLENPDKLAPIFCDEKYKNIKDLKMFVQDLLNVN